MLAIPSGQFASSGSPSTDNEALKEKRRKIKEALLNNQQIKVTPQGNLSPNPQDPGIVVPEGKLASFFWYEDDPELYQAELEAMQKFFPGFRLEKESDGRLSWIGQVTPGLVGRTPRTYTLQAVYDHNHPSNSTYGGSIKVYSVDPDLKEIANGERIPHTLHDSENELYICTARKEDVRVGTKVAGTFTTAAVAISWAVKWLSVFELWLNDEVTDQQFAGHVF
ncbi:MAG: hypothetical protein AB7O67_15245 [Vicinamibacterales bacterium]